VSTGTVSLVLSNAPGPSAATRERVMAAAAELGYRPDRTASLLARRRAHLLGVMLDVRSTFHAELVAELHDAAEAAGYDVLLSTVTPTRDSAPRHRDARRLPLRGAGACSARTPRPRG
jgi:DNA-binding LacI/PurR family transcriptional regulator